MNNLKMLRKELKLSVREIQEYCKIPNPTISYLENGTRPFRQTHIDILSNFFSVTSDFLIGRSNIGYIVFTEKEQEPIILSSSEYTNLQDHITSTVIHSDMTYDVVTTSKRIQEKYTTYSYKIYRELKGSISDYETEGLLTKQYDALGKKLTTEQLQKVINFIKEYIL